jgi:transcriptional regulator with XRE-family HTH domain
LRGQVEALLDAVEHHEVVARALHLRESKPHNPHYRCKPPAKGLLELGERLRSARQEARLTQADLSKRAGIARDTLSRLERGEPVDTSTQEVERAWRAISAILLSAGQTELASRVNRFIDQMPPVRTEKETRAGGNAPAISQARLMI